jgi:hypothetical protein
LPACAQESDRFKKNVTYIAGQAQKDSDNKMITQQTLNFTVTPMDNTPLPQVGK